MEDEERSTLGGLGSGSGLLELGAALAVVVRYGAAAGGACARAFALVGCVAGCGAATGGGGGGEVLAAVDAVAGVDGERVVEAVALDGAACAAAGRGVAAVCAVIAEPSERLVRGLARGDMAEGVQVGERVEERMSHGYLWSSGRATARRSWRGTGMLRPGRGV